MDTKRADPKPEEALGETLPAVGLDPGTSDTLAAEGAPASGAHPHILISPSLSGHAPGGARPLVEGSPAATRNTVLPRVEIAGEGPKLITQGKLRYEPVGELGAGGVGEVTLMRDHDIDRPVAVKRLKPSQQNPAALVRFVEEIRTVGQLEHPNIVPIHDVGVDDQGRYFFVMKYLDGETLEAIISKLAAGDPDYHKRYTFEYRTQLFLGILRALQFAHAQGIIHRDIKPSNVMIGRYGEVVVMDWGIAKRHKTKTIADSLPAPHAPAHDEGADLFKTRHGALLGTPAYMSPEQARGDTEAIDERSDIYSLSVLFHELLTLRHYLADRRNARAMILGVLEEEAPPAYLSRSPLQRRVPIELSNFTARGLAKSPGERYQSVGEMIDRLQAIFEGQIQIQCHITLTKRVLNRFLRVLDKYPNVAFFSLVALLGAAGYTTLRALFGLLPI
jgi:eukaryotic-like serine/threonine-protein kinase